MIEFLAKEIQFFPMKFSPTKATMAMAGLANLDIFIIRRFIFAFVGRVCREHNEGREDGQDWRRHTTFIGAPWHVSLIERAAKEPR